MKTKSQNWEFLNPGCFKRLVVCNFYAEALFCALLRPLALFCRLAFALFCLLCSFCVLPRLEQLRLGTEEKGNLSEVFGWAFSSRQGSVSPQDNLERGPMKMLVQPLSWSSGIIPPKT